MRRRVSDRDLWRSLVDRSFISRCQTRVSFPQHQHNAGEKKDATVSNTVRTICLQKWPFFYGCVRDTPYEVRPRACVRSGLSYTVPCFHPVVAVFCSALFPASPITSPRLLHRFTLGPPCFSQIPLVARSASALACSPTFVFLASSLCLVISVFSLRLHLSHLGVRGLVGRGTQLPEQYKSII